MLIKTKTKTKKRDRYINKLPHHIDLFFLIYIYKQEINYLNSGIAVYIKQILVIEI